MSKVKIRILSTVLFMMVCPFIIDFWSILLVGKTIIGHDYNLIRSTIATLFTIFGSLFFVGSWMSDK